jgi:hypothetical protein
MTVQRLIFLRKAIHASKMQTAVKHKAQSKPNMAWSEFRTQRFATVIIEKM